MVINLLRRQGHIQNCKDLVFPLQIQAKDAHFATRQVYASQKVVIPPRSQATIPAHVKASIMVGSEDSRARMPPRSPAASVCSHHSAVSNQSGASSTFTDATKLEALRLSGPNCWGCLNSDPEFAHVVARKDHQVGDVASPAFPAVD